MTLSFVAASVPGFWDAACGENDDRWRADPALGAFAVADGSGPRYGGYHAPYAVDPALDALFAALARGAAMPEAVRRADEVARALEAKLNAARHGLGLEPALHAADEVRPARWEHLRGKSFAHGTASLVAAVVDGARATIAQVGSNRAYRMRGDALELVARDHGLPAPHETVVTSLLGSGELTVELAEIELAPGDRIVLCSDGAWRCGDDVVRRLPEAVGEAAARRRDSATAIVIAIA